MFVTPDTPEELADNDGIQTYATARRILAERVLRLVSLAPQGILVTHILQADRLLGGPLAKLPPEGIVALIREMLENDYLSYISGTSRLAVTPAYRQFGSAGAEVLRVAPR